MRRWLSLCFQLVALPSGFQLLVKLCGLMELISDWFQKSCFLFIKKMNSTYFTFYDFPKIFRTFSIRYLFSNSCRKVKKKIEIFEYKLPGFQPMIFKPLRLMKFIKLPYRKCYCIFLWSFHLLKIKSFVSRPDLCLQGKTNYINQLSIAKAK